MGVIKLIERLRQDGHLCFPGKISSASLASRHRLLKASENILLIDSFRDGEWEFL